MAETLTKHTVTACDTGAEPNWRHDPSPVRQIAEDCFGEQVLAALRQEMHAARVKCSGHQPEALPAADVLITSDNDTVSTGEREWDRFGFRYFCFLEMKHTYNYIYFNCSSVGITFQIKQLSSKTTVRDSYRERPSVTESIHPANYLTSAGRSCSHAATADPTQEERP